MTNNCNQCGRFVSAADGAKCVKCGSLFHRDCVKLSPNGPIPSKWTCLGCHKGKSKQGKTTIVKGLSTPSPKLLETSNPPAPAVLSSGDIQGDTSNSIIAELRLLRGEMASFRGEIAQLNITLSAFNSRVDDIESRLSRLEEQSASQESRSSVQTTISQLQTQLNDRDQDLLMNDVEISGLQEASGENLMNITCLLAKKLGVDLDDRDVVSAERSGPQRAFLASTSDGKQAQQPRPRPVVVRLARRAVRDELLRAARVRRGVDSSGIIDADPRRFYVNERLTRTNRQLFYKAREEGRLKNYRFVWTKGGRIFVRKTVTASVQRVRSEADLEKIFANDSF